MAVIDDKVVSMSFESSKFEQGVNNAIKAIDKLNAALKFPEAGKGLENISSSAKKIDLSHIGRGVEEIGSKLNALRLTAIAVFAGIAQQAVSAGARFVKAFTLEPLKAGFAEYATNLNAVQTILANTQASGAKLKDVNAALLELNKYSDKTIYNFSQMAKNIGTFTAAGVDLKTSTASIKGIANLAALSGSNADQASTAMYQLSQALSAGAVKLQDWNSVVNAGMGGTVFQRALAQTAVAMGTLNSKAVKLTGPMKNVSIAGESFRNSLSKPGKDSWLTSDVLTKTLQQFTGDLTDAQLKAQGFNDAQIKAIQQTAKTAMHAATEVKTLSQVLDVAKETAGSGWAQTWQIIFGNFGEAKTTFTALSNTINGFINANAEARNKVLADWKALGGRTVLINSIKTAFHNLGLAVKPIKEAFRDIFPPVTGRNLYDLTLRFKAFAEALKPSPETIENLRRTFRGLFALLDIGKQIVGGIFTVFAKLFGAVSDGSGGFLDFTGNIGDFLVSVDEALKKGNRLHNFFAGLGTILAAPLKILKTLAEALSNLFGGFSSGGFSGQVNGVSSALTPLQKALEGVSRAWDRFMESVGSAGKILKPIFEAYINLISGLGTAIGEAATNMNFDAILQVIKTGLFGGLVLMFRNFLGKGTFVNQLTSGFGGLGRGILANISGSFKALQGSMVAMQQNIKAKTLKEIAIAIALLTASVVALSFVDPDRLKSALTAMAFGFGELLGAMAILDKIGKSMGFVKLPFIAGSLILLAGAIDLLSIAVIALSRLSWEELLKGLGGVAALLGILSAAAKPLSANSAGMIRAGIGITAIAIALKILASAVADFGGMSLTEMGKGLVAIGAGLTVLVAAMTKMPAKGMISAGIGLIAISTGLKILASAVGDFGAMNWSTIARGMTALAISLGAIVLAVRLMPKNMIVIGLGLLAVAFAVGKIADAVQQMGGMSVSQIAKGLIALGGALFILTDAMYAMEGALPGAFALTVVAAGVALLAPALAQLGKQSWTEILKSMIVLAAALTILGIAGAALTPVIPSLLGLGAALVLIGGGLALAGAGIFLVSAGLAALAVSGPAGVGVLIAAFVELQQGIIKNVKLLILGLLEIVRALADTAPKFVDALVKILNSLLDVIIQATPKIMQAFQVLLDAALKILKDNEGKVIQAGFDLIIALLKGIRNNLPQLITLVADIIAKFLSGIASNLNKIIAAGVSILTSLLKGIANSIASVAVTVGTIITRFVDAIASNLGKIATAGLSILTGLLKAIANRLGDAIKAGTDVVVSFIDGVANAGSRIVTSGTNAIIKFINALSSNSVRLIDAGMKAVINFLNGVAAAINANSGAMRSAGMSIGIAIADGMTFGLVSKAGELAKKAADLGHGAISALKHAVGAKSPSAEAFDVGQMVVLGLANGMEDNTKAVSSAEDMGNGIIGTFKDIFQITSPSKVMHEIGQAVGQGFAEGLRGSGDDIKSAFTELNAKLTDAMLAARQTIAKEQDKLDELRKAKKPDMQAIREAQAVIKENEALLAQTTAGHIALTKTLSDEKKELIGLTGDYEKIGEKLKLARDALAEAQKTKAEAIKGFADQYATLPDIVTTDAEGNSIDQLNTYMEALKHQADAVSAYRATLDQLRKLGLDDATYQKLLKEGTADQQFATQLLSGGKTAVQGLNTLDSQLQKVSKTLATNAGNNLYQAGIDAAAGLVKGLLKEKNKLAEAMDELADEILRSLKKALKIKSPSEAFAEIGKLSMEGMAKGFSDNSKVVTDAVDSAAQDALTSMQKSMRAISDAVAEEIDPNPVIAPILDLTQIRAQAGELDALTKVVPITAASSYGQASIISSLQNQAQVDQVAAGAQIGPSVKFEQNNYSPEALTEVEIYRQTKNQLSQLKSVLAIT